MDGATRNYSIGNRIDYAEALGIFQTGRRHGFTPYVDLRGEAPSGEAPSAASTRGECVAVAATPAETRCDGDL
jgi:hypothetical protein